MFPHDMIRHDRQAMLREKVGKRVEAVPGDRFVFILSIVLFCFSGKKTP